MAAALSWYGFTAIPNGTQIKNHLYDQCVALANHYNEQVLGNPFVPVASAYQWFTSYYVIPALFQNFTLSSTPVAGGLFVARGGIYNAVDGHIGVITAVHADGTFDTMEQNTGPFAPQRYTYRYRRGRANILGFLIPNRNPATSSPASPTTTARKARTMLLCWDTSGTGYLVTPDGVHGLASPQVYNLFYRLINSDQLKTPIGVPAQVSGGKGGAPDTFNRAEMDIINANLKIVARSAQTGVAIDVEKMSSALSDALGKKFNPQIEMDVEDLARAFDVAAPRITASLLKQAGERLAK